ncbi:hypothetical protein [Variovorax sp. CY25R-8]|uniref:hypothetical protein n=1 Tax=Variovorax sp. CY25R-8 TaxID=2855501 RepID=UPI0021BAD577|nr:hypothetical protein [Variovorax sp. CY25R-8]MCT8175276.1 hypothetical protein [Variovorax sp. CY25R-8]
MTRTLDRHLRAWTAAAAVLASALPFNAAAWEADVHFGLTRWLAVQAGFSAPQADAIATGNQRVDFGAMETMLLVTEYACTGADAESRAEAARAARRLHAPVAGEASTEALRTLLRDAGPKAGLLLLKFGEALHPLQDASAHEGADAAGIGAPAIAGLPCDPPPPAAASGGEQAHRADLTAARPAAALAMARASFEWLQRYPPIADAPRVVADWPRVEAQLGGFLTASTKAAKAAWFREHGMEDTGFLEGISLPDGAQPWTATWSGRRLPRLQEAASTQHGVPEEVRRFFDDFFAAWLGDGDPAAALGLARGEGTPAQRDLAARLRLWRLHDHGAAAALAHAPSALTRAQLQRVDALARDRSAYARYPRLADAFFPLMAIESYAPPLLPYIVRPLPALADGEPRMLAIAKLRHAPYDELLLVAQRRAGRWSVVSLQGVRDH